MEEFGEWSDVSDRMERGDSGTWIGVGGANFAQESGAYREDETITELLGRGDRDHRQEERTPDYRSWISGNDRLSQASAVGW